MKKHIFGGILLIMALVCAACAEPISRMEEFFDTAWKEAAVTQIGEAYLSEGVSFTLEEAAFLDNKLLAVGVIRAADERDMLVPVSLSSDVNGLDSDKSTAALVKQARQSGGRLLSVHCLPKSVAIAGGQMIRAASTGYYDVGNPDGSVTFFFEIACDGAIRGVELNVGVVEIDQSGKAQAMKFTQWMVPFK